MRKDVFYHFGIKDSTKAVRCFYVFIKILLRMEVIVLIHLSKI
jgi:hypothetical protein